MSNEKILTPKAINKYLKTLLEANQHLMSLKVVGEISNFKTSSGNFYFSIKDDEAQINCMMFKNNSKSLNFSPEDGMEVIVYGKIYFNVKGGNYSINVTKLEEKGIGDLAEKFIKLKEKLQNEGLFDLKYKQKIIPTYERVALVTAPNSAAIKDMIATLKRRNPLIDIIVIPTIVQGIYAVDSIVNSIKKVNELNLADVMIVGRGGGSIEDLWAFNEEKVAYACFNSKIPIVSSVGHETDTTIIDYVADLRAATPTAAAELVTQDIFLKNDLITKKFKQAQNFLLQSIKHQRQLIDNMKTNQYLQDPIINYKLNYDLIKTKFVGLNNQFYQQINYEKEKQCQILTQIKKEIDFKIKNSNIQLENKHQQLDDLNPLTILSRGYSVSYCKNNIVKSINDVKVGDEIDIKLKDGFLKTTIFKKE